MNTKSWASTWLLCAIIGLCVVGLPRVEKLPFSKRTATQLNTVSAWLSEKLINGAGIPVRRIGSRLQSTNETPAFNFEFKDGGWILKQFYMLVPLAVVFSLALKRSLFKLLLCGFIATVFGVSVRALLLGFNASFWGQKVAAGSLDTWIRMGCYLFVMLALLSVSARGVKNCEKQTDKPV